jgi:hypothetical protein
VSTTVDLAWVARELAKAPQNLTAEQQRRIRAIVLARPRRTA